MTGIFQSRVALLDRLVVKGRDLVFYLNSKKLLFVQKKGKMARKCFLAPFLPLLDKTRGHMATKILRQKDIFATLFSYFAEFFRPPGNSAGTATAYSPPPPPPGNTGLGKGWGGMGNLDFQTWIFPRRAKPSLWFVKLFETFRNILSLNIVVHP